MEIFQKHIQKGAYDTPDDPRDFQRFAFFGGKKREQKKILNSFDYSRMYPVRDQKNTSSCTDFSKASTLDVKFFFNTGKLLKISDSEVFQIWNKMCELGFADKKKGAYIFAPLKFFKKHPQIFFDENDRKVKIWVEDYFLVSSDELYDEVFFGGGVLTGTSSKIGLLLSEANKYPYIPKNKYKALFDGHAFPILGFGYNWMDPKNKSKSDKEALVHKNSWGKNWGDRGNFYTLKDQRGKLFKFWGYTIGYEYLDKKEEKSKPQKKLYKDVTVDAEFYDQIKKFTDLGIVKGYPDGSFRPANPLSRVEILIILDRFMKKFNLRQREKKK